MIGHHFDGRNLNDVFAFELNLTAGNPGRPYGITGEYVPEQADMPKWLEIGVKVTEEHLLPRYLKIARKGAKRFEKLFVTAQDLLGRLDLRPESVKETVEDGEVLETLSGKYEEDVDQILDPRGLLRFDAVALARAKQHGMNFRKILKNRKECRNLSGEDLSKNLFLKPWEHIVLNNIEVFTAVRDELPALIETARGLAR